MTKKRIHLVGDRNRLELRAAMLCPWNSPIRRFNAGHFERGVKEFALGRRHEGVLSAMDNMKRWASWRDISYGIGALGFRRNGKNGTTQKF